MAFGKRKAGGDLEADTYLEHTVPIWLAFIHINRSKYIRSYKSYMYFLRSTEQNQSFCEGGGKANKFFTKWSGSVEIFSSLLASNHLNRNPHTAL